ncbi:MAG: peptide chain release factor 1 [Candidatus Omnitrophota bacterium]|jgi:peptide chain release factor 1|nr:peptide chain release factor 1 [Candidatus Omnitrophota bacterium]MDD3982443.1 peptide chain release factor 1 [Candidatus Omnitrophota bacterium]MDD5526513.1 peptide chain release factor 1 [Candidatus Omnitrophota bacterium]
MLKHLEKLEERYRRLEELLASDEVVSDLEKCSKYARELAELQEPVRLLRLHRKLSAELEELKQMRHGHEDREMAELVNREEDALKQKLAGFEERLQSMLEEEDGNADRDIIVEIRQGTGGMEAALFAAVLYRMYNKYADGKGWKVEPMSVSETELGGIKEVVFSISGKGAYRCMRFESGVHRVQRVPETESQGRIHTSTATVAVLVEPEDVEMAIDPGDLKIDTYRSSGPGGQHMQKTDSAVRITHIPTGVVVSCQDERSQLKNKNKAMRILRAKILEKKQEEERKKVTTERRSQIGSGERSEKIRTYNYPDRRVTDHRINFTVHRLEAVLEGELEEISGALLKAEKEAKLREKQE